MLHRNVLVIINMKELVITRPILVDDVITLNVEGLTADFSHNTLKHPEEAPIQMLGTELAAICGDPFNYFKSAEGIYKLNLPKYCTLDAQSNKIVVIIKKYSKNYEAKWV